MKFILDAQLPVKAERWLAALAGCDVRHISRTECDKRDDQSIFFFCRRPELVLWSKDQDFVDLVTRHNQPPQVVWVRSGNSSNEALRRAITPIWPRILANIQDGAALIEVG